MFQGTGMHSSHQRISQEEQLQRAPRTLTSKSFPLAASRTRAQQKIQPSRVPVPNQKGMIIMTHTDHQKVDQSLNKGKGRGKRKQIQRHIFLTCMMPLLLKKAQNTHLE